jgi:hypothetical protein
MVKMERSDKRDEFDLYELFFKGVEIIRANFWLIVIFFVVGTLLGLTYYYSSAKVYQTRMVVSSSILTRSYAETLIDKLNRHRRELNLQALKESLNISEAAAKDIVHLDTEVISQLDETKEPERFIVSAEVLNQSILPDLQKGLVHHLANNEFVKIRVDQNKKYLSKMIDEVDEEIKDMEVLKEKIISGEFFQRTQGNVMFDPTTVNSKILDLTKERINLQNNLELVNSVQVIEGFTKYERPVRPKLSLSLISGSFVGLVFVSILIAFKSVRRILRMADAAKQRA